MEVGTKRLDQGNKKEAYDLFAKAYKLYSLFWGVQMKLVPIGDVKKLDEQAINKQDKSKNGVMAKLGVLVEKVIDE
jgi:hypothetical protein